MRAKELRPFDVLKNTLSGELGLVVEIASDKVFLADKTGLRAWFKLGESFEKVYNDESGFKLSALMMMRERRKAEKPPRKKRAVRAKK
jgi:hypothetical protein